MVTSERVVVFDLGGVLVRICRSWREGCAAAGLEVRGGTDSEGVMARVRTVFAAYDEGRVSCEEAFVRLSEAVGGVYSAAELARIHDAWLIGAYDGVDGLVEELCAAGVITGVLSNTNHRHWTRMRASYGVLGRITHPHASHLLRVRKPDEGIYRLFEERTGASAAQMIFFDDLEENVAAAARRGWSAHRVDFAGDTAAQMRAVLRREGVLP